MFPCRKAVLRLGRAASIKNHSLVVQGIAALPYSLTCGQRSALDSILNDMKGNTPLDGVLQVQMFCLPMPSHACLCIMPTDGVKLSVEKDIKQSSCQDS